MAVYYLNEGSFELADDGVVDATVHKIDADASGENLRLMVKRAPLLGGSLVAWAARRAALQRSRLRGYALLGTRDSAEALEFCARYRRDDGDISYLRCAHVETAGRVLCLSATAPVASRDACDAWMDSLLGSLRLRDGD